MFDTTFRVKLIEKFKDKVIPAFLSKYIKTYLERCATHIPDHMAVEQYVQLLCSDKFKVDLFKSFTDYEHYKCAEVEHIHSMVSQFEALLLEHKII